MLREATRPRAGKISCNWSDPKSINLPGDVTAELGFAFLGNSLPI